MIRHLVDEKSDTFISYINNYRYDLNDGMEILWMSERGWVAPFISHDGKTGEVKNQITRGEMGSAQGYFCGCRSAEDILYGFGA